MRDDIARSSPVLGHRVPGPRLTGLGAALIVAALSLPVWVLLGVAVLIWH